MGGFERGIMRLSWFRGRGEYVLWAALSSLGCTLHISSATRTSLPVRQVVAPRAAASGVADGPVIARAVQVLHVVLASDEFYRRLASVSSLSRGVLKGTVPGEDFARQYLCTDNTDTTLEPYVIRVDDGLQSNGITGWDAAGSMLVRVDSGWRTRASSNSEPSLASFGCAINTLAHERVHTIMRQGDTEHADYYTDGGHQIAGSPLASYTVGSIAHCTFFRLYGSLPEESFWTCVERMGITDFWRNACSGDALITQWARPCAPSAADCHQVPALEPTGSQVVP